MSTVTLRIYMGIGYGATNARHKITQLVGTVDTSIDLVANSDGYGLTLTNSTVASLNVDVIALW